MKKLLLVIVFIFVSNFVRAQLIIDNTSFTPQQLAQNVLLGQGINISNIKFNGSSSNAISDQIALFDNGSTTNIGINKGIILGTGNTIIAKGPNDRSLATLPTSNSFEGDADLSILTNNQPIRNVAVLEFDFVPIGNKLTFNFVFASDEYPEFVNDLYNDNFGFFLSGPGISGPYTGNAKNIALIPTSTLPVSINNLNNGKSNAGPCEYCQYYIDNTNGATIQYDGFTKVIQASSDVECGQTYHIKLAIANVDDNNYDSAVFIEGASFKSSGIDLGEDLKICSATTYTLKTGLDPSVVHEWKYNGTVIPSQTGPEITVNQSGTYAVKATPSGIGCPVSDDIKIDFATIAQPYLYCGTKTSNSITFDWLALGYAEFSVAYQIGSNPKVDVGFLGKVYSYTVQNVPAGETVTITVTPIGTPAECYGPNSISCILDTCVITPTLTHSQGAVSQQVCQNTAIADIVYIIGGGATSASITSGNLPAGVTTSLVGNTFTISGIPTSSGTFNYTISTQGGCGTSATVTGTIIVYAKTDPLFTTIAPICEGELFTLPLQSNNGITGTWTPALNNLTTTEYTFTPNSGQCANTTKLTVSVKTKTVPTFNTIAPICEGDIIVLPSQSNNGISGTWSPAINNLTTTEYTFIPNSGECAISGKLTVEVNQKTIPTFNPIAPICEGDSFGLQVLSNNGIAGTWSPAINNSQTTEYTFTPNSGECATSMKTTVVVNKKIVPTFAPIAPLCYGETMYLPSSSTNGITGRFSSVSYNTTYAEGIFTPDPGQCATIGKVVVEIFSKIEPKIENGQICIEDITSKVVQSYLLNTQLSNSLYTFEWFLDGTKIENEYNSTLEAKKAGHYAVIAIDRNTICTSSASEATVTSVKTNSGELTIIQSDTFSENANVAVNVTNALGFFEYQIDNLNFQSSNEFTNITPGKHIITARSNTGCITLSKEFTIIGYPKFFTPNGDGHNDTWNITSYEEIENDRIFIFDRYGKLLKQLNSKTLGWDGTYNGHQMPATDYWFKILFTENKIEKEFKSHFTLKR
ncbi:T9SS type B sorting domain-containing protein [Flavobacterium sp. ASV13]|uniref:T9SS type B sorting domain-containing protein n=1 Tax=Flavobacterium sp. ASV13 TaxID=1506583 RepID=UPI00068E27A3|nr:choice-of-anchor L domain-containing protein [Flavobacterium sp. ASV13]